MADDTARGRRPRDAARFEDFLASLLDSGGPEGGADASPLDPERTQIIAARTSELTDVSGLPSSSLQRAPAPPSSQLTPTTASGLARVAAAGGATAGPTTTTGRRVVPTGRSARVQAGPPPLEQAAAIGLPNDQGLTSAGLVCEALSGFGLALSVIVLAATLVGLGALSPLLPFESDAMVILALMFCVLRAVAHGMLGRVLTRRDRKRMFRYTKAYFGVAVVQTLVLALALGAGGLGAIGSMSGLAGLGAIVVVSIAWPTVLLVMVLRPANRRALAIEGAFDVRVLPNDRGVAGAGTIMLVGGVMAALGMAAELFGGGRLSRSWVGVVVLALLLVRSCVHAYAGVIGLRRPSAASFAEAVTAYRVAAYVSGGAFGALALVTTLAFEPVSIILLAGFVYLYFLLWPRRLARFTRQVAAEVRSDDIAKSLPTAPDGGLSALGYCLLWAGCYQLAIAVGSLFAGSLSGGVSTLAALVGFGQCALTMWAGLELARMTPRWRVASWIYGGVTIVVSLGLPLLAGLPIHAFAVLTAALALLTIVLVSRPLRLGAVPGDMVRAFDG
jgi:hypothetical protein